MDSRVMARSRGGIFMGFELTQWGWLPAGSKARKTAVGIKKQKKIKKIFKKNISTCSLVAETSLVFFTILFYLVLKCHQVPNKIILKKTNLCTRVGIQIYNKDNV